MSKFKNRLTLIGFLGGYTAYLNVSGEDALRRWKLENEREPTAIRVFEFDDEFECYDAQPSEIGEWVKD